MPTDTVNPRPAPARPGAWQERPPGLPGAVPPPSVPLCFLAAASLGLVASGAAWAWAREAAAVDPTADPVVAAAHLGLLATLSMGVLGAMHQFVPVVSQRPLRSVGLARATFVTWLLAAWLLPLGVATEHEDVVEAGGGLAALAITLLVVNLSYPLAAKGKGAPVTGLRFALAGFVVTASFGVLYVADRKGNWFDLSGHVVLAHAVVGLFAWLGLTYVAVAEKLWPMFFLAHVPGPRRPGHVAVWAVPAGVALLSPGLLVGLAPLAAAGATVLAVGLGAHFSSLRAHVRYRRRKGDLHLAFVLTSAMWLPTGGALALAAVLVLPSDHHQGTALVAASVAAIAGWLLEALVGHAYKVVPFIGWSALRSRGVDKGPGGKPIMFADLYNHTWAAISYGLVTTGIAALCAGLGADLPAATATAGGLFMATGLVVATNLSVRPARMLANHHRPAPSPPSQPPAAVAPASGTTARSVTLSYVAIAMAATAALIAVVAVWQRPGNTPAPATAPAGGGEPARGETVTARVSLGEFYVRPAALSVPEGATLVLQVANRGTMDHDLQLEGGPTGTGMLAPGRQETVSYGVVRHNEQAWCTVAGHRAAGMVLDIWVTGPPQASAAAAPAPSDAVIDYSASPPPGWHAFGPALAPATGSTVHHVTLVAEDKVMAVAPGVTQDMWTFDGQVPAPTLRGHVGDLFVVTLVNHTDMDHSLDFHAASMPMGQMKEVAPGQSVTYRFRAEHAGIFLYHCGTPPVLEHLANGMYGAVVIDPPGLPEVAQEYLVVQSELYLGPPGSSGDYQKMVRDQPDATVFNGYADQYLHAPLRVKVGQPVRIWVLDAGPNDSTSFHVVGAQFTTVFKEGAYLLRPGAPGDGASQVLDLSPGEGGFVQFTPPAPGYYEMLDHQLDHAATGAAGYLLAS